ncbi:MAG: hypothetical protein LBB79_04715 [Prevotellaceae bacterium]|jgi:hypothetical protein|nr:hypothetical protein [Prevotellaceae bacterium]
MKKLYKTSLTALGCCIIHTAYGNDADLQGYDADHINYFYRMHAPDKSIQLGFAAGCSWYVATPVRPDDFRSKDYFPGKQTFSPNVNHLYAGVLGEKNFFNMRIAVATGLYFSRLNTYLLDWPGYEGAVYFVDYEDDEAAHYTSVSNVRTASTYVSIPVELSCALANNPTLGFYLKGSAMANINVGNAVSLIVDENETKEIRNQLSSYFTGKGGVFINATAVFGLRWGSYDSPNFRMELGVPFVLSNDDVTYLNVGLGLTARVSLHVPLFFFYQ